MKRRYVKNLEYIGSGKFRALLSCQHVQVIEGSTRRLPRIAPCQLCKS